MASNRNCIQKRIIQAARQVLQRQNYVSAIDVLTSAGMLQPSHILDWKKGRIPYLEKVIQGNLGKISFTMKCFRDWALKTTSVPLTPLQQ
jgi:hypothetical protein